jgi:chromosome segregation ATPase
MPEGSNLSRGVFGYSGRSVERLLERESERRRAVEAQMLHVREEAADLRYRLERELEVAKDEIQRLTADLDSKDQAFLDARNEVDDARDALRAEREQIGSIRASLHEFSQQIAAVAEMVDRGAEAVAAVSVLEGELAATKDELRMKALETWTAEQENVKLREEYASLREQSHQREAETGELGSEPGVQQDAVVKLVSQEMSGVLDTVVVDVVQRVRRSTLAQLEAAEDLREEARQELERLMALRESLAPVIHAVQVEMERAQARVEDVPTRLTDALAPLTQTLDGLVRQVGALADAMTTDPVLGSLGSDATPTIHLPEVDQVDAPATDDPDR